MYSILNLYRKNTSTHFMLQVIFILILDTEERLKIITQIPLNKKARQIWRAFL